MLFGKYVHSYIRPNQNSKLHNFTLCAFKSTMHFVSGIQRDNEKNTQGK